MTSARRLIVGLGSPHGDDAAGWHVVDEIARIAPAERVRRMAHPADLLDLLSDVDELIVCDACRGPDRPGTVRTWTLPLPEEFVRHTPRNSHELGLVEVLRLAEQLGDLPAKVGVWTIEADKNGDIDALSDSARVAIRETVAGILAEND
ncbi:MAG TPA: hydrogenase maturation protease [Planctomycetaceae bacterium]|nr:hydrogenase maturation protease [Planctomycetaceae bacterium]